MMTEALIDLLARGAGPAPRGVALKRLSPAVAAGLMLSAAAAISVLGLIPASLFATAVPWIKMIYAGAMAVTTGWLAVQLARPAAPVAGPRRAVMSVVSAMVAFGLVSWFAVPAGDRMAALLGHSWFSCPPSVLVLSLPALAGTLWAVRGLAPIRLHVTGFAAGLLAGSVGAFGYSLACPEASAAFVAVWYSLGILLTGALGAALGPHVLRW